MWRPLAGVVLLALACSALDISQKTCSRDHWVQNGASAYLSGLVAFHEQSTSKGVKCGPVSTDSMQAFEAVRWAMSVINMDQGTYNAKVITASYIKGIKFGMKVHDSCYSKSAALGGMMDDFPETGYDASACTRTNPAKIFFGVLGTSTSDTSKAVSTLASQFSIGQISYSATDTELSDKSQYPTFMRTIPPNTDTAKATVQLLKALNWKYIALIHDSNSMGKESFDEIRKTALSEGICVTFVQEVDSDEKTPSFYDALVNDIDRTGTTGAVFVGNGPQAKLILEAAGRQGKGNLQWVMAGNEMRSSDMTNVKMARGALFMEHHTRHVAEFENHWVSIDPNNPSAENPWFKEWWMTTYKCKLIGINYAPYNAYPDCGLIPTESERRNRFVQSRLVEPAIHAVYTYANALEKARVAICRNAGGLCSNLATLNRDTFFNSYLKPVKFTYSDDERLPSFSSFYTKPWNAAKTVEFDSNGDIKDAIFGVWNYAADSTGTFIYTNVGEYMNNKFVWDTAINPRMYDAARNTPLPNLPSSLCPNNQCPFCISPLQDRKYYSSDGTFFILSLLDVHRKDANDPYKCGLINTEYGMDSEWFIYALKSLNDRTMFPGMFNGITFGGLGIDTCSSPDATSLLVTQYQSGMSMYKTPSGRHITPLYTTSYLPDVRWESAHRAADLLKSMVQVHASDASPYILDASKIPYGLTTAPSDEMKVKALVNLLTSNNWFYVQTFQCSCYGSGPTAKLFHKMAKEAGICVVAHHHAKEDGSGQSEVIEAMRKHPQAKVLVSFARTLYVKELISAVKTESAQDEFLMITDKCDLDYTDDADGLMYIKLKPTTPPELNQYLDSLDVTSYSANPWFKDLYQAKLNCYLEDGNNPMSYPNKCTNPSTTSISSADSVGCGCNSVALVTAVYAIGRGVHKTLEHFCGTGYNGFCSGFRNSADYYKVLHKNIEAEKFKTVGGYDFEFINRHGNFDFEFYNFQKGLGKSVQVGEFDTETSVVSLSRNQIRFFNNTVSWESKCTMSCATCINQGLHYVYIPGDVILGGLFHVRGRSHSPFTCSAMTFDTHYQYSEAFKYALSKVKAGTAPVKLNNVELGALMFDDCNDPIRASSLIFGTHSGEFDLMHDDARIDRSKIHGWLSYSSEPTRSAGKVVAYNHLPLITPSASSISLRNLEEYPTLYRTVSVDDKQAYGMALLAKKLGFTYLYTVQSASLYGRSGIDAFKKYAKQMGICIAASYEMNTDGSTLAIMNKLLQSTTRVVVVFASKKDVRALLQAKKDANANDIVFIGSEDWNNDLATVAGLEDVAQNSLTFKVVSPPIAEFDTWMSQKTGSQYVSDPWFKEWYQLLSSCNLPNSGQYNRDCIDIATRSALSSGKFQQGQWTLSTVNAVYSYVHALDAVLKDLCGVNYNGVCDNFKKATDVGKRLVTALADATFTDPSNDVFKFIEREGNKGYTIHRFHNGSYNEVGKYDHVNRDLIINSFSVLNSNYQSTPSVCTGACSQCRALDITTELFSYIPGDLLLGGMFDVHNTGDDPFSCGAINDKNGFQLVEAFNFAIKQVNQRKGIFSDRSILAGTTLGGIAFDSCKSGTRAGTLLANVHSGLYSLKAPDGTPVNSERIEAYVGGLKDDVSLRMAQLLNVLSIPQISYGSTSMVLNNRANYPYFFRTVPADDKQARGIVSFLKSFDLKYVQVVSSPGSYGEQAAREFIKIAPLNGICVSQHVKVDEIISPETSNAAVSKLEEKPKSSFVILFLEEPYVEPFVNAVHRNAEVKKNFRFCGSHNWGLFDELLTPTLGSTLEKSVTMDIETADLPDFDDYLKVINPTNHRLNPWLEEFYQHYFKCNLPGKTGMGKDCDSSTKSLIDSAYKQDPYILYVVNAVYSAAIGLHETLTELCGVGYDGPCAAFKNSGQRRQFVMNGIAKGSFVDATKTKFSYNKTSHESNRGYHIYSVEQHTSGQKTYYYENVGSYNDTDRLKIYSNYEMVWNSNCLKDSPSDPRCKECPDITRDPTRYMQKGSSVDLNLLGFFPVHNQGTDQYRCGSMNINYGFQNMLAFYYAIEKVNMNEGLKLAPSVKLGGLAVDTCSSSVRARNDAWTYLGGQGFCGINSEGLVDPLSIMAIVPMGSETTIALNDITSPPKITMVSPSATSSSLLDDVIYPYVLRTVPPDTLQAEAITAILRKYGHTYVQVIQTDDEPDNRSTEKLLQTNSSSVCVANRIILPLSASDSVIESQVNKLTKFPKARVVIVFASTKHARQILKAIKNRNLQGKFTLIGSASWADLAQVSDGYEDAALGAITLKIRSERVNDFVNWVAGLSYKNTKAIPSDWFEEFWQHIHKCRDPLSKFPQVQYDQVCTREEDITPEMIAMDPFVYHTIISVYEIAKGINDIPECRENPSLDVYACVKKLDNQKQKLYDQIFRTQWLVDFDKNLTFKFTSDRYGDIGYYIYNYVKKSAGSGYEYNRIGSWQELLDMKVKPTAYSANGDVKEQSISVCPLGGACSCINGKSSNTGGNSAGQTENKWKKNLMQCEISEAELVQEFSSAWGIVVTAFSGLGAIICCILLIYLCFAYPIKGGTSVLGFFVLLGLIMLFLLNIAFVFLPSFDVCGIRRFCQGLVYAMIFSPLLLKVLNAWRVGDDDTGKYKNLSHPVSFFFIAVGLVLVQVIINAEWLILVNPTVDWVYVNEQWLCRCSPHDFHNEGLVLSCVYVMVLIFLTAIFGFVTYDNELNHREARWVLITTLFTMGCWIVWTIVSTLTDYYFRDPSIAIANVVNAYIILGCIFIRKMWLLSRYQKEWEDEKRSQYAASRKDDLPDDTLYHNEYNNSAYDAVESPNSHHSGDFK